MSKESRDDPDLARNLLSNVWVYRVMGGAAVGGPLFWVLHRMVGDGKISPQFLHYLWEVATGG
jgi:hypothetical protein